MSGLPDHDGSQAKNLRCACGAPMSQEEVLAALSAVHGGFERLSRLAVLGERVLELAEAVDLICRLKPHVRSYEVVNAWSDLVRKARYMGLHDVTEARP